jgi:lysozyme
MIISKRGIEFIKSFESFSPIIYKCPAGVYTIGYGHTLRYFEKDYKISREEAEKLLFQDICLASDVVIRNIRIKLTQNQFDALISFVFNVGSGAFQRSSLRHKINSSWDDEEIHYEFLQWVYAGGKKMPGLLYRRKCEAEIYSRYK